MILADDEKRMLDGEQGEAVQHAMDLLVRYGDVLGAERFVDTDNVCGANIFGPRQSAVLNSTDPAELFSQFSLDSDKTLDVPPVRAHSCQLIGPMDTLRWEEQGFTEQVHDEIMLSEEYSAVHGINLLNTCTPYQVGIVPLKGEHCAWMESSAVIYINSVLGARTNTEGRESTAAAMITGKIPYWGFHTDEYRYATHHIKITCDVSTEQDWGVLGYFVGETVGDGVPVMTGRLAQPQLKELKHFGASAASAGDVEMYHIPGITNEANTLEQALGGKAPEVEVEFGIKEWRRAYEHLNSTGDERHVDLIMLGCPHANLDQIREICRALDGRKVADGTEFWVFTPRAIREVAERNGHGRDIRAAGGQLMSDTCPAMGMFVPPGTRAFATDSAKQVHYLPAIKDVQGWFGTTQECVDAAITGRWEGAGR